MSTNLKNVTLKQLRAFAGTVESGSLTGAAERVGVTQPAISLQLQNLQELAGLPLLQRTPEGFVATEAGEEIMQFYARVSVALRDCMERLAAIRGATGGRVSVGAVSTSKYFVPAVMGAFARRFPEIEIKLRIGNRSEILDALRDFSLDIAITGRPPDDLVLETHTIGPHPHILIAAPDHRLRDRKRLTFADLRDEIFINREAGSGTRLLMERLLEDAKIKPRVGMELDSNETIKQAVMAGLGIAFISGHTTATEIQQGRLITLPVEGLPIERNWYIVRQAEHHLLPPAAKLLNFLRAECAQYLPHPFEAEKGKPAAGRRAVPRKPGAGRD
ncbi:MAG: LysR family transcriptional regulator [Hyphomicrobiales bacterium]|nr:LysR family transcriptional regulator [Hyphomicrobiales bacterium]MDE2114996.1 LysR family transcriptional regulator [Hyphomicrobiales bacterium]